MTTPYTPGFYDTIASGSISSAAKVAPRVIELIGPIETVADVGCGQGWWGREFERLGAGVSGFDGAYVEDCQLANFTAVDLAVEGIVSEPYDLVVCLEVAEHLPADMADKLVETLDALAHHAVLFSAAIPGQTGAGHINCQWPAYWIERFERLGWFVTGQLRNEFWNDTDVEPWYRQNMLLFTRSPLTMSADPVLPLVHPEIWAWKL